MTRWGLFIPCWSRWRMMGTWLGWRFWILQLVFILPEAPQTDVNLAQSPIVLVKFYSSKLRPLRIQKNWWNLYFRVGVKKLKAKICSESGTFETVPIPANYKDPQSKYLHINKLKIYYELIAISRMSTPHSGVLRWRNAQRIHGLEFCSTVQVSKCREQRNAKDLKLWRNHDKITRIDKNWPWQKD